MTKQINISVHVFIITHLFAFVYGTLLGTEIQKLITKDPPKEVKKLDSYTVKDLCLHSADVGENKYTWRECK